MGTDNAEYLNHFATHFYVILLAKFVTAVWEIFWKRGINPGHLHSTSTLLLDMFLKCLPKVHSCETLAKCTIPPYCALAVASAQFGGIPHTWIKVTTWRPQCVLRIGAVWHATCLCRQCGKRSTFPSMGPLVNDGQETPWRSLDCDKQVSKFLFTKHSWY